MHFGGMCPMARMSRYLTSHVMCLLLNIYGLFYTPFRRSGMQRQ